MLVMIFDLNEEAEKLNYPVPFMLCEPGRSIVADAGMTLYTVGTVKKIPGYKNYASIDGGMTDNPRYALYESKYTVLLANRMEEEKNFTCDVVGRCCESGDLIQENIMMPKAVRDDLIAVLTTAALIVILSVTALILSLSPAKETPSTPSTNPDT